MRDPRSDSAVSIIYMYMLLSPFTPKFTTKPQMIRDTTQIIVAQHVHVSHQCELFRFLLGFPADVMIVAPILQDYSMYQEI